LRGEFAVAEECTHGIFVCGRRRVTIFYTDWCDWSDLPPTVWSRRQLL
jgi:hypothetical protein